MFMSFLCYFVLTSLLKLLLKDANRMLFPSSPLFHFKKQKKKETNDSILKLPRQVIALARHFTPIAATSRGRSVIVFPYCLANVSSRSLSRTYLPSSMNVIAKSTTLAPFLRATATAVSNGGVPVAATGKVHKPKIAVPPPVKRMLQQTYQDLLTGPTCISSGVAGASALSVRSCATSVAREFASLRIKSSRYSLDYIIDMRTLCRSLRYQSSLKIVSTCDIVDTN